MSERPDGPISGLLYEYSRRLSAASNHAVAEGHDVTGMTVLDGYDRTLHPWMHGRRPADLAERVREFLNTIRARKAREDENEY